VRPNPGDGIAHLTLENIDVKLNNARPMLTAVTDLTVKNVKLNGQEYDGPGQGGAVQGTLPQTRPGE
jgi:hypothetical protein